MYYVGERGARSTMVALMIAVEWRDRPHSRPRDRAREAPRPRVFRAEGGWGG